MQGEDETVLCPETFSISSRQVMPFLLDMSYTDLKLGVKPSVIIAALKLTTEERLEKLRSPTRNYKIGTKKDTFSRCPEAIIFQNFKKGTIYTTPLTITNQKTVPKNIQIQFEASLHFKMSMDSKKNHQTRIAPGMSYTVYITFLPNDSMRDYVREVKIIGDEETFTIPVYGLGPRPMAMMPDKIVFPSTLVKVQSTATVVLKNTGLVKMECVYDIEPPFSCEILRAIIPPKGILEMKYVCYPTVTGVNRGQIKTYFKNQLCVATELECEVSSARIELERHNVIFEDVYMGLSRRSTLVLHNTSNYTFNFSWKMYDEKQEQEEFNKMLDLMEEMRDYQIPQYKKLEFYEIVDRDAHADIYKRILEDEKKELFANQNEKFLFSSSFFDIIPRVGRVLPRSDCEFSIIFSPQQNICYESAAYLDIEGTEQRVRVSLLGNGIGPPVMLCVKKINASQIYLTDKHQYELAVKNKGVISATVTYQPNTTDWGGVIDCLPKSLVVSPDSTSAFIIVFYSEVQGDFLETLDFIVEESQERLQCIFTGTVVCPLLKCIPEALDFGTVSVGLTHTRDVYLENDSRVIICFEIEIDYQLRGLLEIFPLTGTVNPHSRIQITISFSCGALATVETKILLIMWKSRQYTKTIPFTCICSCPKIVCSPQNITIKFCFLNCEYYRSITLENTTDLSGYVEYEPLQPKEPIQCMPHETKIYLNAHEVLEIQLKITVTTLGPHEAPVYFKVIGGALQHCCTIYCNGQGPVISYHPDEVDFGPIEVLKKCTQCLTLVNDSPICAKIRVYFKNNKPKSPFQVEENNFELAPEKDLEIPITALFTNAEKVKDIVQLEVMDSDIFTIKVFGEGIGTPIVCEPALFPKLDLGIILTYKNFIRDVVLTNKSSHLHRIFFTKDPVLKSLKETEVQNRNYPTNMFNIEPRFLEIESDQDAQLTIQCFSKKAKSCEEEYYCHGFVGKATQPQLIMKFFIAAEFKDPHLEFSQTEFNFNINVNGTETSGITQDILTFNNKTGVPLQVVVTIDDSFSVIEGNTEIQHIVQEIPCNSTTVKQIYYHPKIKEKRRRKQRGRIIFEYENHPKSDIIHLFGEVMFPTIRLYPNVVDFHCIPLGSTSYMTVVIQNISAMVVTFSWLWLENSITINDLNPIKGKTKIFKIHDECRPVKRLMDYIDNDKMIISEGTYSGSIKQEESDVFVITATDYFMFYTNEKYLEEMKKHIFPILAPFQCSAIKDENNITPKRYEDHDITKLFALEPSEGILLPNEYTLVTIGFSPPPNTEVMATVICKVLDGEEEQLIVMGKSTKISYTLDKKSVNFGNQVFCEVCTDELTLTNNGLCCFPFKVVVPEVDSKQAEMLDITPKVGSVLPEQSVRFKIDYFPGFPGKFEKPFMLELGYLEPVSIKVHGYAVVSQVFLRVPRLSMDLSVKDCYKALAWITPEYLDSVQSDDNTDVAEDVPVDLTGFLEENDWTYISYNESYPSLMDINLAMERIVALNHILKNKNILKNHSSGKSKNKTQYIPNFLPPSYCVDFGYVVRDMPVCYTVLLYNYGPIDADVKLLEDNKSALLEKEFKIEFRNKVMAPGETLELFVLFSPTKRRCKELYTKLEDVFRLTVSHGPIISVKLKAEVTLPSVTVNSDSLYFERVYIGDVLRKTKILRNDGNVPCKWFASISKSPRKGQPPGFFVAPNVGELEPGVRTYLNIYFVPTLIHKIKRTLQIEMELNEETIYVDLFGEGLETILKIAPTELKFPPTLSFFDNSTFFTIENLSGIPVEIYFPSLDKTAEDEKMIIQIYLKYKNLKQVYIPLRTAGQKLPAFFTATYENLVEKLKNRIIDAREPEPEFNSNVERQKYLQQRRAEAEDPLAKFTPEELKTLLNEYISAEGFEAEFTTKATTYLSEDSSDFIEIVEPEPKEEPEPGERSAVLLIFHGASTTEFYRAANEVGIALSFPVYSIDRLIIESLVEETHPNGQDIVDRIHERFEAVASWDIDTINRNAKEDNPYDKILDEITGILTIKPKKGGKKPPGKEHSSKASSEKSQSKNKDKTNPVITDCFLNINPDQIVDLLRSKLKQFPYLVIESLESTFIPKANLALYTILRAAGAIQHIHLVILSHTVDDYVAFETAKLKEFHPDSTAFEKNWQKTQKVPEVSPPSKGKPDKKSKDSPLPRKSIRTIELSKKVLQSMGKNTKIELEKFETLQREIVHITEYWDRKNGVLKKPYTDKLTPSKRDAVIKDSSRTVKSSVKRTSVGPVAEDGPVCSSESGLHLWLVLNASYERPVDYCEMIRNCMATDSELQNVVEGIQKSMEPVFEESETLFSVIAKPTIRQNISSSAFIIRNFKSKSSSEAIRSRSKSSSNEIKIRRRRSSKGSRKSADSKVTVDNRSKSGLGGRDEFSTRIVLQPEESMQYEVAFTPVKSGKYSQYFYIEDTKHKVPYKVICNAVCEYPRIDFRPEIMFPKTLEDYRDKASYDHFVFIKDQKIFDFGSILVENSRGKAPVYSADVLLKNPTSSICEVTISLGNNNFYAEPKNLVIRPKGEEKIKLCIKPTEIGTITSEVFLSVKNSPRVEDFTVACSPCKLEFNISPKLVTFEKVPLSYKARRIVRMTNSSPITLRWEFVERDWSNGLFDLSGESGYVSLYSVSDIVFYFKPKEELNFPKKHVQIRIFDVNKPDDPCFIDTIMVHADSVEYNLEVESLIDYGEIKGGTDCKHIFHIINKGKCEVSMMFHLINNPTDHNNFVREFFRITPHVLTIGALKTENISVTFHPTCNLSVERLLLFVINMVESVQSGHTVKSYKVNTSATVFMPSIQMCPQSEMIFGQLQLLGSKKMILEITNTGRFSFSFALQSYAKYMDAAKGNVKKGKKEKGEPEERKSIKPGGSATARSNKNDTDTNTASKSKGTQSSKIDKKKIKATHLDVDGYALTPSNGIVEPNERFEICVEFSPREIKEYNEDIILDVAEIEDVLKKKVFTLKGFGCEPRLNLRDYENVFIEQYTVSKLEEFIPPKNIESYCVFVSSEVALHFKLVCINTTKTINLNIKNIGFVPANLSSKVDDFGKNVFSVAPVTRKIDPYSACILAVTFKPDSLESLEKIRFIKVVSVKKKLNLNIKNIGFVPANLSSKVDDFGKNVFSVAPVTRKIDPYSGCILAVTFKPGSLEVVRGILEISYNATTDFKLSVQLFGQACLPQIKLLNPIPENNIAYLNFGPICVGQEKREKISFQNVGSIKTNVIVEISDSDTVFEILPDKNTTNKLNVQIDECIANMKDHMLVNLLPEELAEFEIIYKPTKQQCIPITLSLHIIYNPFEVNKIILNADSYDDDIIIDDLKAIRIDTNQQIKPLKNSIGYLLDFGHKELNKLSKLAFFLRNRSAIHTFKFTFNCNTVTFIPEMGHLKPHAFKEVLVIFKASKPVLKNKEELSCSLTKIEYVFPESNPLSWDDRQKFMYYVVENISTNSQEVSQWSLIQNGDSSVFSWNANELSPDGRFGTASSITTGDGKPSEDDLQEREYIEEGTEPEFTTLSEYSKIMPLFLTVAANYSKYACETSNIQFRDTFLKEKSVTRFEVKNTGTVPLNIRWEVGYKNFALGLQRSSSSNNIFDNISQGEERVQSASASSLFSTEDYTLENDFFNPITIDPVKSVIEPEKTGSFDVIFAPEHIEDLRANLKSNIEALDPNSQEMCIFVCGRAVPIPFYIQNETGDSTNKDLSIKFESVGNGTECCRNVLLVNPHDNPMSFEIVPQFQKEFTCFTCETPTGNIRSKKKAPLTFSFTPHTLGSFKTIYILRIPEKNVDTNILLEGECRPPKVYFTETIVVLKPTVPRVKIVKSVELLNDEIFSLSFKFIKKSLFDDTQHEKLEVHPIVGKLKPKSRTQIRVTFITSNIVNIKFHLKCIIERAKSPIILNVSASCIEIESLVSFTDKSGSVICLDKDAVNVIDLGQTYKGRKEIVLFEISNMGQTGMFFAWKFDAKPVAHLFTMSVDAEKGFVKKDDCATIRLYLEALRLGQLKQFQISLDIMYGPTYKIHLNVISDKPIYSFSFTEYNFGYCFLQKGSTKYYSTMLNFKNLDSNSILLENTFDKTEYLTVDFTSSTVQPGESRNILISFHPQYVGLFQTNVSFLLGNFEQIIPVSGEGVEMRLELCNPKDKFIKFGEVLVDTPKKYKVCVVNNSSARMDVHFTLYENLVLLEKKTSKLETVDMKMPVLPIHEETKKAKADKKKDKGTDTKLDKQKVEKKVNIKEKEKKQKDQEKDIEIHKNAKNEFLLKQQEEERREYLKSFMIIPNMFIDIPPRGKGQFEIVFQPNKRINFEEKVYFEIQDHFEPICIIKGIGVSPEFSLDRTDMLFPAVIMNCSKTQLITLRNTGDVIGSFNWSVNDRRNVFDIEPKQGFVLPNNDMKMRVTFSPKSARCEYKVKLKCVIKQYKEPLYVVLKGNSIKVPEPKEIVSFHCNVREHAVQTVSITNTSSEVWTIHVESSNAIFFVPKEITALPFADTQIQITYSPKLMTRSKPDEGILFIKLSSGGGMKYKLIGDAGPPSMKKRVEKEIYCKQNHYVTLPIENWLDVKQSFSVFTEVISPLTNKTLYKILGMKTVQLDGKQSKNYRWGIYLVNEVPTEFRVTFKNTDTGEYEFYEIGCKVLPAQLMETISFNTRVREPITKQFSLDNPVDIPITFTLDCASERHLVFEKSLTLNPYTTTKVDLTYTPLRAEDILTILNARCEELGVYSYSIKLHADSPKLEKCVIFKAELGERTIQSILFKNVLDRVVEFSYKFDNDEFSMERCAPIQVGESSKIAISFDPSALGPLKSKLYLNSQVAGEYVYPLEGEGVSSTPKGPFIVRQNYATSIEFKNPFNEDAAFKFELQPDIFYTEIKEDIIKSRKSTNILVYIRLGDTELPASPITGKLRIFSADIPELEWTYYLLTKNI